MPTTKKKFNRYDEIKNKILQHDYNYYVLDRPIISDYEYDQLFNELIHLEKENPELISADSPTLRVGGAVLPGFQKIDHRLPMLSLSNTYSAEDLLDFDSRVKKFLKSEADIEYFCELKLDGLAIELVYEKGLLIRALTRGDGQTGEDVTANIKTIRSIPLRLHAVANIPDILEVRGEALIHKKDFLEMNAEQDENGESVFANPRNAAAGTIRQLDPKVAAQRPLRFYGYAVGVVEGLEFSTQEELESSLEKFGIPILNDTENCTLRTVAKNIQEVISFYHEIENHRESLPFEIDGIVVKVNSMALQNELGLIARSPRWATASKYKPQQAETIIENIHVQVGRTGALTPVAIMKPVKVGGVVITNATLHNYEEIQRKDIRVGDHVLIQRAGDVIPEVVSVIIDKRPPHLKPFVPPSHCPICSQPVTTYEGEVVSRCTNSACPAILKGALEHFVARRAMNIDKVGEKLISTLVDSKIVTSFSDLYRLNQDILLSLERQGEKSVDNIIKSIEKSKKTTLSRFIFALGIRFVGEQTAKSLANHFQSLSAFLKATPEQLLQIEDIGPKVAESISKWLNDSSAVKIANECLQHGVYFEEKTKARAESGPLSGFSFLITGTLPIKRDDAKDFIESKGGKIVSAVSAKLNYLVVGDDPGSKVEKAQSLGVTIISWDELLELTKKGEE